MGLTSPLALLLAAFISLPLIAHFIRRADVTKRTLPTVALLARIAVQDRNRARVTEPFLLALRVLAIALVVLAAAAPFLTRASAYGDGSSVALAIVIDDSLSMGQRAGNESAFEAACDRAREVVNSLGEGSEVALIGAGSSARVIAPRTTDRSIVLAALDALELGARGTDLRAAIQLASRQLASARFATRRTLVLSDFAGQDAQLLDGIGGDIDVEALVESAGANASIVDARVTRDPLDASSLVAVIDVQSSAAEGALTVRARPLDLVLGEDAARAVVPLRDGRGRATLRFRAPANTPFVSFDLAQQAPDALPADDTRIVSLAQPTPTQVVLIEPTGSGLARHAARALGVAPQEQALLVRTMDADRLQGRSGMIDIGQTEDALGRADVVMLIGVIPTNRTAIATLTRFTEGGGGLLFMPTVTSRVQDLAGIAELFPGITMGSLESQDFAAVSPVAQSEAVTLLPPGPTGLESLHTRVRLELRGADSDVWMEYADGAPFAIVQRDARRAVLSVGADPSMSDLPLRVGFVPVMLSLAQALARPGTLPHRPFAGGEVPALSATADVSSIEVTTPSGAIIIVPAVDGVIDLARFSAPGGYRTGETTFVIAAPAAESNLVPVPPTERVAAATHEVSEARTPVAQYVFLLVGVLTLIEGFMRFWRPRLMSA